MSNEIDFADVLVQGRQLLDNSEASQCVEFLVPILQQQESLNDFENAAQSDSLLEVMQLGGEALLELGNPQDAYKLLEKAVQFDPQGERGGSEKFLWMGQLAGDRLGLQYYEKGIDILKKQINQAGNHKLNTDEVKFKRKKISDALCGMVEIWMTDLCMEPEAEQQCENNITEAMLIDETNPETWNVMSSIRISQQRNDDAKSALQKSWDLYHDQLNTDFTNSLNTTSTKTQEQQQLLIPSLVRLAQNSVEMELLQNVIEITAEIQRLDDQVPECYYLHGLARAELYKKKLAEAQAAGANGNKQQAQLLLREANKHAVRSQESWETLLKVVQEEPELADPELAPTVTENLKELPTNIASEDYDSSDEEEEEDINVDDLE